MGEISLRCRICETGFEAAPLSACSVCGGPLDVAYRWEHAPGGAALRERPSTMWRYREVLPHAPAGGDAGLGFTPLVPAGRLAAALGIDLRLKLETANPTRSFKDRLAASAVAAAQAFGLERVCCTSTGHLGEAVAARCAARGVEAIVLAPDDEEPPGFGGRVFRVRGGLEACRRLEHTLEQRYGWGFVEGNLSPFAVEGAKTVAFEIAEQLDWQLPDAVVCPLASGTLFAKLAQGFAEARALGLAHGPVPRLIGGQAGGCPPLAAAFAENRPPSKVTPRTGARSLAVGDPRYGELALGAARVSGGSIRAVGEDEIPRRAQLLAEATGVVADSAAGVAVGALLECVRDGSIAQDERVVLVVTGTGANTAAPTEAHEIEADAEELLGALGRG